MRYASARLTLATSQNSYFSNCVTYFNVYFPLISSGTKIPKHLQPPFFRTLLFHTLKK